MVPWAIRNVVAIAVLGVALFFLGANGKTASPLVAAQSHGATSVAARHIPIEPPPLGWSSWNSFSNTINSQIVMRQARAMVDSGMQRAGYQYINIDEGWWLGQRDASGNIVVDAEQWPALKSGERAGDMANIVRYIHSLGLKAGIYTDAGEDGCGFYGPDIGPPMPHTGAEGHYEQDLLQFARWGFDYVKVDWCGGDREKLDPAIQYAEIAHAITRAELLTKHHLFYSICEWGNNSPWTWAAGIGGVRSDIWRTSGDIVAPIVAGSAHSSRLAEFKGVLSNFDQGIHPEAQHTGYYNDLDMMVLGMPGLDDRQNRVHMSLWAISGAPLLVGADLTKLSATQIAMLTESAVLAIDQDAMGLQGVKVSEPRKDVQIWCKVLFDPGMRAVLLLNRGETPADISLHWSEIGLSGRNATVKDVWAGRDLGSISSYSSSVGARDAVLLLIHGTDVTATNYAAASSSAELQGGATAEPCNTCASGYSVALGGEKEIRFVVAAIHRPTFVQIQYLNEAPLPLFAQLRVDGRDPTTVLFPPTATSGSPGSITVEIEPSQAAEQSTLDFSSNGIAGPSLVSVSTWAIGK